MQIKDCFLCLLQSFGSPLFPFLPMRFFDSKTKVFNSFSQTRKFMNFTEFSIRKILWKNIQIKQWLCHRLNRVENEGKWHKTNPRRCCRCVLTIFFFCFMSDLQLTVYGYAKRPRCVNPGEINGFAYSVTR